MIKPLFQTTNKQRIRAANIVAILSHENNNITEDFLAEWLVLAINDKGVFELGELLYETEDPEEHKNLVEDIQKLLRNQKF